MFAEKLRKDLAAVTTARDAKKAELEKFATDLDTEARSATPDEDALVSVALDEIKARNAEIADIEGRLEVIAEAEKERSAATPFQIVREKADATDAALDRNASPVEMRDAVLRSLDENDIDDTQVRSLFKRHGNDNAWARNIVARSTDTYASAFGKYITGRDMLLSNEERAAMSVGTNANGGFLVPTHLDPTIILTNEGSTNAIRQIARVVTLTEGNQWNGITSAGVSSSWAAELAAATDASPSDFAHPGIPVHRNDTYVTASIEAFQDIDGLASDVLMLFADARDRLEGAAHCTGSGNDQPTGIFTALDANTNVEVVSTTAATIGLVDLQKMRRQVGQRWRGRSSWVMNPVYADEVKRLGTALSASYSTDITQANTDTLLGRPVIETDDAPETQTTTVRDNEIVFGDFSNYVIVDKPGSTSIEFIQNVVNGSGIPTGARGWVMWNRSGADSVNDLAFRMLQDKTSA
jgi:HK97 family phage major capsid protein